MTQTEIIRNLESLQKNVNKGTLQISNRQKEALTEAIQQMKEREKALPAYFTLKNWLYDQKKPLKIKSAMCWGWIINFERNERDYVAGNETIIWRIHE